MGAPYFVYRPTGRKPEPVRCLLCRCWELDMAVPPESAVNSFAGMVLASYTEDKGRDTK